eukprot:scpid62455/ scgid23442/ 
MGRREEEKAFIFVQSFPFPTPFACILLFMSCPTPTGAGRWPGFQWSKRQTMEPIAARSDNDHLSQDVNWRKRSVWVRIAERIARAFPDEVLLPTTEQCENRWNSLMKVYIAYMDSQQKTGSARKPPPPFVDDMNNAFGWKPSIAPVCIGGSPVPNQASKRPAVSTSLGSDGESESDGEEVAVVAPQAQLPVPPEVPAAAVLDTALHVSSSSLSAASVTLQTHINKVVNWMTLWKLKPNASKTAILCFPPRPNSDLSVLSPSPFTFPDDRTCLSIVDQHKHLGIILDQHLSFDPHITYLEKRASSIVGFLSSRLSHFPRDCRLML